MVKYAHEKSCHATRQVPHPLTESFSVVPPNLLYNLLIMLPERILRTLRARARGLLYNLSSDGELQFGFGVTPQTLPPAIERQGFQYDDFPADAAETPMQMTVPTASNYRLTSFLFSLSVIGSASSHSFCHWIS